MEYFKGFLVQWLVCLAGNPWCMFLSLSIGSHCAGQVVTWMSHKVKGHCDGNKEKGRDKRGRKENKRIETKEE